MFGKKKCPNCREKINGSYNFCPYCQAPLHDFESEDIEDWGMLGRNDSVDTDEIRLPMGLNTIFNSLVKNLNKQLKDMEKQSQGHEHPRKTNIKKGGLSISISTSGDRPPEIKVRSFGNIPEFKEKGERIKKQEKMSLPSSNSKKFSGLPKEEPKTEIRRFSNKVVYEIKLPGVKSTKDISIIQLENSIEIKALSKGKVFYKIIPINLPIRNYALSKGKLVLELDAKD
jgi:HSP20 family molecular chaperone IbpA